MGIERQDRKRRKREVKGGGGRKEEELGMEKKGRKSGIEKDGIKKGLRWKRVIKENGEGMQRVVEGVGREEGRG